jgi:GMP synthase (glutamine-hydrolysing)
MEGSVEERACGVEFGTVDVSLTNAATDDPLFCDLTPTFPAQVVHWQSVVQLPKNAIVLARSPLEPYQAFRVGDCTWGVQFHPEMSRPVMYGYLEALGEKVTRDPSGFDTLYAGLTETPVACRVLRNFCDYVTEKQRHCDLPAFEKTVNVSLHDGHG